MSFFNKLAGVAAAGLMTALVAVSATPASAATCSTGSCAVVGADGQVLDTSNNVTFSVFNVVNDGGAGSFQFDASFVVATDGGIATTTVLQFSPNDVAFIRNLTIDFDSPDLAPILITNNDGSPVGSDPNANDITVLLDLSSVNPGNATFSITGDAEPIKNNPSFTLSIAAVPVPAALPLFASALLGLGLLSRRRRNR